MLKDELGLAAPPVALAFVDEIPNGVATLDCEVPSACTLWRHAEREVFYAPAARHLNCPVGAMVLGFRLPEPQKQELQDLVGLMGGCDYLEEREAGAIPTIDSTRAGLVYGPLSDFPIPPDLILLWVTPKQAMLFSEAAGTAGWLEQPPRSALGRPACAAIPAALSAGGPLVSLGCMGMRTFTEVSDDQLLAVLPGALADQFLTRFAACMKANRAMQSFYEDRKTALAD